MNSLEEYKEHIPPAVYAAAEKLLADAHEDPRGFTDVMIVSGWKLEAYVLEYVSPPENVGDIFTFIVDRTAVSELQEKFEELDEDMEIYHSSFVLGSPKESAFVLVQPPKKWWAAEPLEKLIGQGILRDATSGNDSCPSLGNELMDGMTLQIYTGHPNPDHHTRYDGCDPRFAIYVYDLDTEENPPGDVIWSGENEEAAAREVLRLIKKHGGVRRAFKLNG